jgi:hypothetical protein
MAAVQNINAASVRTPIWFRIRVVNLGRRIEAKLLPTMGRDLSGAKLVQDLLGKNRNYPLY